MYSWVKLVRFSFILLIRSMAKLLAIDTIRFTLLSSLADGPYGIKPVLSTHHPATDRPRGSST
jgi:hypothetical protein